jgi:hypothetical protein
MGLHEGSPNAGYKRASFLSGIPLGKSALEAVCRI